MSSFFMPVARALDANGAPISGAKLNFYEAGTSTPKDTYSDKALTTANANPVVADSDGWFGRIYLATTGTRYKVQFTDASDVEIWAEDNVDPLEFAGLTSLSVRVGQIAADPLTQGAVGDGVNDEQTEVQAAIDAATGTVDLLGKTFRCDSDVTLASGITLKNGTLDFSQGSGNLVADGTLGSSISLDTNYTRGGTTLDTASSVGGFGDVILVEDTGVYGASSGANGELAEILASSAANTTLYTPLRLNYATANSAGAKKLTTVDNVSLENLTIIVSGAGDTSFKYCKNLRLDNVRFVGDTSDVIFESCYGVSVERMETRPETNAAGPTVFIQGASDNLRFHRCTFRPKATSVDIGAKSTVPPGVIKGVSFIDCEFRGTAASTHMLDISDMALGVTVKDCWFWGDGTASSKAIYSEGGDVRISGCKFHDIGNTHAVHLLPTSLSNASATNDWDTLRPYLHVHDCDFIDCDDTNIEIASSSLASGKSIFSPSIERNRCRGTGTAQIIKVAGAAAKVCSSPMVRGNYVLGDGTASGQGIRCVAAAGTPSTDMHQGPIIQGNVIDNVDTGILCTNSDFSSVEGNTLTNIGTTGISAGGTTTNETSNHRIFNNYVEGAGTDAINVTSFDKSTISGNTIDAAGATAINLYNEDVDANTNRISANHNTIVSCATGIALQVGTSYDANDICFSGNNIVATTRCVYVLADGARCKIDGVFNCSHASNAAVEIDGRTNEYDPFLVSGAGVTGGTGAVVLETDGIGLVDGLVDNGSTGTSGAGITPGDIL